MISRKPINPNRIRRITGSFSWIDHRILHDGYLEFMSQEEMLLYFFLVLVGLEEVAKTTIITEGLARSFLILIWLGLVVWLVSLIIFGVALAFISSSASLPNP